MGHGFRKEETCSQNNFCAELENNNKRGGIVGRTLPPERLPAKSPAPSSPVQIAHSFCQPADLLALSLPTIITWRVPA